MKDLIDKLLRANIRLSADGDELVVSFSGDSLDPDLVAEMRANKQSLLDYLRKYGEKSVTANIESAPMQADYDLSPSQQRLWLLDQLEGTSNARNVTGKDFLRTSLDLELFEASVNQLIERHEILRTVFVEHEGEPRQKVLNDVAFKLPAVTTEELTTVEREVYTHLFDLQYWPLFNVRIIEEPGRFALVYSLHHIIADGWSKQIFTRDLLAIYAALQAEQSVQLPKLSIQYKDFALWQSQKLTGGAYAAHQQYWTEQLASPRAYLRLPQDYHRTDLVSSSGGGGFYRFYLNAEAKSGIEQLLKTYSVSFFAFCVSSFTLLIHRITGETDLIVGTPVANRDEDQVQDLIGFFLNTLMLRTKIQLDHSYFQLLQAVNNTILAGLQYQAYPFELILDQLDYPRNSRDFPISSIFFNLIDFAEAPLGEIRDFSPRQGELSNAANFEIEFYLRSFKNAYEINCVYDAQLFKPETIEYWMNEYLVLLSDVIQHPERKIKEFKVFQVPKLAKRTMAQPNWPFTPFAATEIEQSIPARFRKAMAIDPDQIAIRQGAQEVTYQELGQHTDAVAHTLMSQSRSDGARIGLLLEHGIDAVVGMLAALKAEQVYVPLDPAFPLTRLKFILKDSNCQALLVSEKYDQVARQIVEDLGISLIPISHELAEVEPLDPSTLPHGEAYVLYTSGSTGQPKGVVQSHRNVLHFIRVYTNNLHLSTADHLSLLPKYTFDASVMDVFGALLNGATLDVYDVEAQGLYSLDSWIQERGITVLHCVPTVYRAFLGKDKISGLDRVRLVVLGGEAVNKFDFELFKEHFGSHALFINGYGPTESTITTQNFLSFADEIYARNIPIGVPVADTEVEIVDEHGDPLGVYGVGEIVHQSEFLALRYLNRPEETAKAFRPDTERSKVRRYFSGDLGRLLPDGTLEFVGRRDKQTKIRGRRIELSEIEYQIRHLFRLEQVVVAVKPIGGTEYIVAYLTKAVGLEEQQLKYELKFCLPEYMIPQVFIFLDEFPYTPSGKVSRRSLPEPTVDHLAKADYKAPTNPIEAAIVKIWEKVLGASQIGVKDDFFALGGNSLKVLKVQNAYHQVFGVEIKIRDLFSQNTPKEQALLIGQAEERRFSQIPKIEERADYPLSAGQTRLWLLSQMEEEGSAYTMPFVFEMPVDYDIPALQKAMDALVARHESLRTVFRQDAQGEIRQFIHPATEKYIEIEYRDLREREEPRLLLQDFVTEDAFRPFDLAEGPLLRLQVFHLAERSSVIYFNMHHIVSDGWSMNILQRDLSALYVHFSQKAPLALPDLNIQYKDYVDWLNQQLLTDQYRRHKTYWQERLAGVLPVLDLPASKTRPRLKTNNGNAVRAYIKPTALRSANAFIEENGGSLFILLASLWNLLFFRYTGNKDILLGTPVFGRNHSDLNDQIGFFVNTMVLRIPVDPTDSFQTYYTKVKDLVLTDFEHQNYPFSNLVEDLAVKGNPGRSILFDIFLSLKAFDERVRTTSTRPDNKEGISELGKCTAKFDLEILHEETEGYLRCDFIHNRDVYEQAFIERLFQHFEELFTSVVTSFQKVPLTEIPYVPGVEQKKVLADFNDTATAYPANKTILDYILDQVHQRPDKVAVSFENKTLTYRELDEKSSQLAHSLRSQYGLEKGNLIGVKLYRSERMVISLLGILKAGGAYVPIDPEYPKQRIDFIQEDSQCRLIIDEEVLQKMNVVNMSFPDTNWQVLPNDLAYVIYTSGTTGKPKGVKNNHGGLLNRLLWAQDYFQLDAQEDVLLQKTTFCFDVSVWEFFWPLMVGARLVVARPGGEMDVEYLHTLMASQGVTSVHFVPSMLEAFLVGVQETAPACLRRVLCSGEALQLHQAQKFQQYSQSAVKLHNLYGPTEAAIDVTCFDVMHDELETATVIPIGKPVSNTQIYILDGAGNPCGVGIPGELFIGGAQVAQGYLNRSKLTQERFLPDPFAGTTEAKMYRTGDTARWQTDGNIEYLGRKDFQVKVRGFRIELGEIEHALLSLDLGIKQVAVAVKAKNGLDHLVAYLVSGSATIDNGEIRSQLRAVLPAYMVPSFYLNLETLPLNANGKLDRAQLPGIDSQVNLPREIIPPVNRVERVLMENWQILLGLEQISVTDNFFDLGGNSLMVIRLCTALKEALQKNVKVKDVFSHPILRDLANHCISLPEIASTLDLSKSSAKRLLLSHAQERLWFIDQLGGSAQYHIPYILEITGALNLAALDQALRRLLQRHEILRTTYHEDEGEGIQKVISEAAFSLEIRALAAKALEEELRTIISKPFDLELDFMLRSSLFKIGEDQYVLAIVVHHIAFDAWSLSILVSELRALYREYDEGLKSELPPLAIQYADYSKWERQALQGGQLARQLSYWETKLDNIHTLKLPTDYTRPAVNTTVCKRVVFELNAELQDKLQLLAKQNGATLFMLLLAIFKVLLYRYTNSTDICVGTAIANRGHKKIEPLIGFFVNNLALRTALSPKDSFLTALQAVTQTTLAAYDEQAAPFELVVKRTIGQRDRSRSPLFQTMFLLQNAALLPSVELGNTQIAIRSHDIIRSEYDLTLAAYELNDRLAFNVDYCVDLFSEERMQRLATHYQNLVEALIADPTQKISHLRLIPETEKRQIVQQFNPGQELDCEFHNIKDWFENQVLSNPQAVALELGDDTMSYAELNASANQLAHCLLDSGVTTGSIIPLCTNKSFDMVVAILGIIKAGAAYLPIDVEFPAKRAAFIVGEAAAPLILTHRKYAQKFNGVGTRIYELESLSVSGYSDQNPAIQIAPKELLYVIYTSGTTGQPKGVMVEHQSVTHLIAALSEKYAIRSTERIFQFSNYSFDASVEQMFLALLNSATLILYPAENPEVKLKIADIVQQHKVSHFHATPSFLETIVDFSAFKNLNRVIAGGEVCSPDLAKRVAPYADFYNEYGPTETTVTSIVHQYSSSTADSPSLPIGRPIANTHLWVLSDSQNVQPVGVEGELYIGGKGVARGYLNRPDLTTEKFVENPFVVGEKMYRTGDLVRWRSDGKLEFIGRRDRQVKIRGYRIELTAIESHLREIPEIKDVIVTTKKTGAGHQNLIVFWIKKSPIEVATIKQNLSAYLPAYMVPQQYVEVDQFPMNSNGKTDFKALLAMDVRAEITADFPSTQLTEQLTRIWQDLLQTQHIGLRDNFFEIGGDSILSIKMLSQVKALGYEIALGDLFAFQTIADLAQKIEGGSVPVANAANTSVTQKEVVFIPGLGGSPLALYALGGLLTANDPLLRVHYLTDPRFENGAAEKQLSIKELAALYVAVLKERIASQTVILIGYSFGAYVGYEMSKLLAASEIKLDAFIILDANAPHQNTFDLFEQDDTYTDKVFSSLKALAAINEIPFSFEREDFLNKDEATILQLIQDRMSSQLDMSFDVEKLLAVYTRNGEATLAWEDDQKYPLITKTLLLKTQKDLEQLSLEKQAIYQLHDYGWGALIDGEFEATFVDGTHQSMLKSPHVDELYSIITKETNG
ncbi:MAG: amino acid adenylation domain-containing protein [Bacteroidota bacterium]